MGDIFLTQEIGSIQRPIWRLKLDAPSNDKWIKDADYWGKMFGVDEREELTGLLKIDGRKRTPEKKQRIVEISSIYVIRMLEYAGLDRIFNGEQPRTEMYDTLARMVSGISQAGFVNSFDANYFKKGIIYDEIRMKKDGIKWFVDELDFVKRHAKKPVKPCFTGPYTMTDWSFIEYYRKPYESRNEKPSDVLRKAREDAVVAFAKNVLNPVSKKLVKAGASVIQIDEPAATTYENESELFTEAMNECFKGISKSVEKAIHLCYSNYHVLFPELAECKADSYLIEFTNHASPGKFRADTVNPEAFKLINLFKEYGMPVMIGVGVIDIHSDIIEKPEVVRDRIMYAAKLVGDPSKVQVNPDCGLRTRRWEVAVPKLVNMVKGTEMARKVWE